MGFPPQVRDLHSCEAAWPENERERGVWRERRGVESPEELQELERRKKGRAGFGSALLLGAQVRDACDPLLG